MVVLDVRLDQKLEDADLKRELVKWLWKRMPSNTTYEVPPSFEPFFRYYSSQCNRACLDDETFLHSRTHQDVLDVVQNIQAGQTREAIAQRLEAKHANVGGDVEERVGGLIDLAARILSMIDVGQRRSQFPGRNTLSWENGTLPVSTGNHFNQFKQTVASTSPKLEEIFNAQNLRRVGSIEIEWTSNLAEHLLLVDDDRKVVIFHHAAFLKAQQESISSVLPKALVSETLDTLALLFPSNNSSLEKWYRKIKTKEDFPQYLDHAAVKCGRLQLKDRNIEHFSYWGHRLALLAQAFENGEPKGLEQWWFDRRRRVQWSTFWIAVAVLCLTIFFGLVQSIEGALQVYKAYHPT